MKLPEFFKDNFRSLMEDSEYQAFKESFDKTRYYGLRVNTLKIQPAEFLSFMERGFEAIPWAPGFYYPEGESFGKFPAYHAGLYYIQEPSAMMPAQALLPKPGEKVLDLCAAPGGKTTHLGSHMQNKGLLVTNDINPKRVKALVKNVELAGLTNTFVTNETPQKLQTIYPGFFDKILLDVPCSGEGMFRKDRDAIQSYTRYKTAECVLLQREIMAAAYDMLKPGGAMVYSTCTFNPEENERNIEFLIKNYDLQVERLESIGGFEPSRGHWTESQDPSLNGGLRLWPHRAKGEGHFVCRLIKNGIKPGNGASAPITAYTSKEAEEASQAFFRFAGENIRGAENGVYHLRGHSLYRLPPFMDQLPPVKWEKAGLYLGEYQKGRFEPSQSLAMSYKADCFMKVIRFNREDHNIIRYLKGETLFAPGEKGYQLVCMEDYPLGWAKLDAGTLKNLYPKGWRMS
ncbi:MAG TPA: SAM-dependent methyltransferase [Ruminiclostridium sp.]|nr:SAM-dependent methyltransferase [Ruminiclostridium sp.]